MDDFRNESIKDVKDLLKLAVGGVLIGGIIKDNWLANNWFVWLSFVTLISIIILLNKKLK